MYVDYFSLLENLLSLILKADFFLGILSQKCFLAEAISIINTI